MEKEVPNHSYFVRVSGEPVGFTDDEKSGILLVKSFTAVEMKKYIKSSTKVLTQEFNGGREIHIFTRSLGALWNGKMKRIAIIDLISTPKITMS